MALERRKNLGEAWETVEQGASATSAVYGELTITGNATPLSLTNEDQWYQVVSGWAADQNNRVTMGATSMTADVSAIYATMCAVVFVSTDPGAETFEFGLFRDGVLIPDHLAITWAQTGIYPNTVTITGVDPLAIGEEIDLRVRCTSTPNASVLVSDCNFSIFALAGIP